MTIKDWNIKEMTGYTPITTIYTDLSIADHFGKNAVQDTIERVLNVEGWIHSYKELTELVMALNWKIWEHANTNKPLARFYQAEWDRVAEIATSTLQGEELDYYYTTTD